MNPTHNFQPKPNFRQGAWVMYRHDRQPLESTK